jgi:hypothetical protein
LARDPWVWTLQLELSHYSAGSDRLIAYRTYSHGVSRRICACSPALQQPCEHAAALGRGMSKSFSPLALSPCLRPRTHSNRSSSSVMNLRRSIRPLAGDLAPLAKSPLIEEESGQHSPRPYGVLGFQRRNCVRHHGRRDMFDMVSCFFFFFLPSTPHATPAGGGPCKKFSFSFA